MGLFMIDEKKLLDKLQQWHDDAEKMNYLAVSDDAKIDMVNNGDFNCD